jgi:hypothetical protein
MVRVWLSVNLKRHGVDCGGTVGDSGPGTRADRSRMWPHLDVPLYWQCWKLGSPIVDRITDAVRAASEDLRRRPQREHFSWRVRRYLRQAPLVAGWECTLAPWQLARMPGTSKR